MVQSAPGSLHDSNGFNSERKILKGSAHTSFAKLGYVDPSTKALRDQM